STLYKLTWKPWAMPSGRLRSRLRASVLRTSETARTGWPTPTVSNDRAGSEQSALSMKREDGTKVQQRLQDFAMLTGWATPAARDWHSASASQEFLASRLEETRGKPLSEQAFTLAGWPTPNTMDIVDRKSIRP